MVRLTFIRNTIKKPRKAFTLIERLAIIAIINILAALLLPALAKAKQEAQGINRLNNLRQLTLAWVAYCGENGGRLPLVVDEGSFVVNSLPDAFTTPGNPCNQWVYGDMTDPVGATNTQCLTAGLIYPDWGSYNVFKDPADPTGAAHCRSMAMNYWMNGDAAGLLDDESGHETYQKTSAIAAPANFFLLIDENHYAIDAAAFQVDPARNDQWVECPATYHNGSGGLSYTDGHAEIKHWTDPKPANAMSGRVNTIANSPDLLWRQARSTYLSSN